MDRRRFVAGGAAGAYWWLHASHFVSTDNAYAAAEVAQVTPSIGGTVLEVLVRDTQAVKQGDVLVRIDPTDARLALAQAEAELARAMRRVKGYVANDGGLKAQVTAREADEKRAAAQLLAAEADMERATIDLQRRQALARSGSVSGEELTQAQNAFAAAKAQLASAVAAQAQARANREAAIGAKQVNAKGEIYETKYGLTTPQRIFGTVEENRKGNGPCYLDTRHITAEQQSDLYHAYLNMAPAQTLKWIESGKGPKEQPVEVEGTEPYVVGGHTASGFWVDTNRETTIHGLFAAGDVAGGAPQKYVTGALAEGEIAADALADYLAAKQDKPAPGTAVKDEGEVYEAYEAYLSREPGNLTVEQLEEAMQKTMDEYAGGIHTDYRYNRSRLTLADEKIEQAVEKVFDLTPAAIIRELDLRKPIYRKLAAYGHMGREDLGVKWENTDRVDELKAAVAAL